MRWIERSVLAPVLRLALKPVLTFIMTIAILLIWTSRLVQHGDSNCDTETFLSSPGRLYTVTADRVYVNPKTGRHQVFGVFTLPRSVEQWSPALLTIDDIGVYCYRVQRFNGDYDGIMAGKENVLMISFVRTRTAIGLFLQGKLNRIRNRTTWHYTYKLRS